MICAPIAASVALIDGVIEPERQHGGDRRSEAVQVDSVNLKTKGGTSASYRRKRLKRDRPDLFEKFLAGNLTLTDAEVQAGISTVKTPLDQLLHWWSKASKQERQVFMARRQAEAESESNRTKLLQKQRAKSLLRSSENPPDKSKLSSGEAAVT